MAYTKTTWTDGQNKYNIKDQSDNVIHENVKIVYVGVGGTPVSSTNMNNIENGLEAAHALNFVVYGASTTGNDTYVITPTPAIAAYMAGMVVELKIDAGNTGPASININAKGATLIKKVTKYGKVDLSTGDMISGGTYILTYDGTYFILANPTPISSSIFTAAGDMIYAVGHNDPVRRAIGTDGQILEVVSGLPAWRDKEWNLISSVTLGSDAAQVDFSSLPSGYKNFRVVVSGCYVTTSDLFLLRFNSDTSNKYQWSKTIHQFGATPAPAYYSGGDVGYINVMNNFRGQTTFKHANFIDIILQSYKDSSNNLWVTVMADALDISGLNRVLGRYQPSTTADLSAINVIANTGRQFMAGTTFKLYGGNL